MSSETGVVERLPVNTTSPWWGEHRSRYRFAQRYVNGRSVLDIACGTGFGCRMMAEAGAREVIGVDASPEAVQSASRAFAGGPISFVPGDGTELPFPDARFDVVVSFETLEHIDDRSAFIGELRRVLKPEGRLILSTPNAAITEQYPRNPYHLHEYRGDELREALKLHFSTVTILGQTLAGHFRVAPFLPGWDAPRSPGDRFRLILWKLVRRLPHSARNLLTNLALGRPFFPQEDHYQFVPSLDRAHVLLALCEV